MKSSTSAAVYDPFDAGVHTDPYPRYAVLRERYPVYENAVRGFWALSRFDDVQRALRDWESFSSARGVDPENAGQALGLNSFLDLDPPRHDELRSIVAKAFSPKSVHTLQSTVQDRVDMLINAFIDEGRADLAQQLAWPLPFGIVSYLLGFPAADSADLERLFREMVDRDLDPNEIPQRSIDAAKTLRAYFETAASARRGCSSDDLLGLIVSQERTAKVTRKEIGDLCFLLFVAAYETTASFLSNAFLVLNRHPDQRAMLVADPTLIPRAIEELFRYQSPIQFLARTTTRRVELHETEIPSGAMVLLLYASANRDERRFANADQLDFGRDLVRHLTFGDGIHFCLGAPLARLESAIALGAVLRRLPNYEVVGSPKRTRFLTSWGLDELEVTFATG